MVHALKPNPLNNQQEWWRIWDFFSAHLESTQMFTFLLDDVGIPQDYRHMDGFGVHTYKWINASGFETLVKYHWVTRQGVANLVNETEVMAITNNAHAQADLYNSIQAGQFPIWDLYVQTLPLNQVNITALGFDPLDVTKTWPEDVYPLQPVGYMELNQTISNFFSENEQLAFSPASVVPGIYYSDDKLLQGRLFAYSDTQRHRLGGNYLMLPVNQPRCPYRVNMFDGVMNFMQRTKAVNYFPSVNDPAVNAPPYPTRSDLLSGQETRATISPEDNFSQAGTRYRTFDPDRQERFNQRLAAALGAPNVTLALQNYWLNNAWANVDNGIYTRVKQILGI
jgi:catalase